MKLPGSILIVMLASCNVPKTIYVSNKTGGPITLLVDSFYKTSHSPAFKDSINGLKIEKKKVFAFGKGKWTREDKDNLNELLRHTKIIKDGSETAAVMPGKTRVSHISFNVEELWVNIKK